MARLGGLGKGLGALIPPEATASPPTDNEGVARLESLPILSIEPNPNQPRVHFDETALADLAASIAEIGVLQPVLVRPVGDGRYQLVAGERRWRAARRAGLAAVPAVVQTTDELGSVERALVENLHRQDLTPLEESAAYQQLVDDFHLTHEQIATRVGKSRSAVSNSLRLLALPPGIQHLLADGRLSAGHAKALLGTPDRAFQEQIATQASSEGWTVRMVEEAVRAHQAGDAPEPAPAPPAAPRQDGAGLTPATRLRPPGLLELEALLADHLSTRVSVTMGAHRGKVVIDFADLEDLERIYRLVAATDTPSD